MVTKDDVQKNIEFLESNNMSLMKFYNDLNKAVVSNNVQCIWQLSKIITRIHLNFVDNKNLE